MNLPITSAICVLLFFVRGVETNEAIEDDKALRPFRPLEQFLRVDAGEFERCPGTPIADLLKCWGASQAHVLATGFAIRLEAFSRSM